MAMELRKTGIGPVGDMPWGTHFCHFYETKEDLRDILVPYFKMGLENNEFCLWVVSDPLGEEEARNALQETVAEADRHLEAGSIEIVHHRKFLQPSPRVSSGGSMEIVPHTELYLKDGELHLEHVINRLKDKLSDALTNGYAGMRANGNEGWLTNNQWQDFSRYEQKLNEIIGNQRMIVLCSYALADSGAAKIFDVVHTHQFALVRRHGNWEVLESPELKQAKTEIKRLNEDLEQRVMERTRELAATNLELKNEITERKQAEDALRRSEDRTRLIIDTIPTMAWSVGPDGTVDFINQRWLDYTGLTWEQYVKDQMGAVHPDDVAGVLENWRADIVAEKPYEAEMRLRRTDGEYRWFLVRVEPLRDEQGNLVKWYGVSIDIEDRKQAEEKLKQSESQLAGAQRLAHVGSWDYDLRTNSVTWSDELYRIFGVQPGQIKVAGDAMPFIHPDDRDLVFRTVKSAIKNREPYSFYYRVLRPHGDERIVHSRGFIVSDENGNPIRVVGATQDVTELRRAEEELKAKSEQLRALSASLQSAREEEGIRIAREIHDELGSALSSLRWDLEGLEKMFSESGKRSQVPVLRKKIAAMLGLTDTTINIVRRIASELRPSVLDDLGLAAAIRWQARQFQERTGIVVHCNCYLDDLDLNQERSTAVFRIFQEALTNILRHAQATRVDVKMVEEADSFVLIISDNGKGITEREKSSQLSVGLLGMRERAHLIGGEIEITGIEGEGTTVTVRLPMVRAGRTFEAGK